jgi:glycine cleavage system H lipoate-binding protein
MENSGRTPTIKAKKDLYYTNYYEWIEFLGSVAYIGVCPFKLAGIKKIEKIEFSEENNLNKSGEVVASIIYDDYKIDVHMPVSGKVISINDAILSGNANILLKEPETAGFIALIIPSSPYEREGLIIPENIACSSIKQTNSYACNSSKKFTHRHLVYR